MNTYVRLRMRGGLYSALVLALGAAAFVIGHYELGKSQSARADSPAVVQTENLPSPNATPLPNSTPDTTKPFWAIPYLNQDNQKPRLDQEINGIKIGPTVKVANDGYCHTGDAQYTEPSAAGSSLLSIGNPKVPQGASVDADRAISCNGTVVAFERVYFIAPAADAETKIRSGAATWSQVQHGGSIQIFRGFKEFPAQDSQIAAERLEAGSVNGHPAVLGKPILSEGLGNSIIVVWDPANKIETVVWGIDVTQTELMQVAEGVSR